MIYQYLFYRFYIFFYKQKFRKNPKAKAKGVIIGLISLNAYTILSIIKNYFYEFTINVLVFILIPILIIVFVDLIINNNIAEKIINHFSEYTKKQLLVRRIIANIYVISSIVLFFIFMENLTSK